MRETMLPPPPSTRIAAWALLNAFWFRVVDVLVQRLAVALRVAWRGPDVLDLEEDEPLPAGSLGALARDRRLSSLFARLALDRVRATAPASWAPGHGRAAVRDERPTAVDVRRPS